LTSEEKEYLEFLKAPKFKALPLDRKILESGGVVGIKKTEKLPTTAPEPFNFATDSRLRSFSSIIEEEKEKLSQLKETMKFPTGPTVPASPHLQTKERAQVFNQSRTYQPEIPSTHFKAKPAPHSVPFVPKLPEVPLTEPKEFRLRTEHRGELAKEKFFETMSVEQNRLQHEKQFKARPMPIFEEPQVSLYYLLF
jgi:hypothetical protein